MPRRYEKFFREVGRRDLLIISALQTFEILREDAEALVQTHRAVGKIDEYWHGGNGGDDQWFGREESRTAINRAIIVVTVAAWQAYLEDLVLGIMHAMPGRADELDDEFHQAFKETLQHAIKRFSTPNADQTRTLLRRVGFDPWPAWTWRHGRQVIEPATARTRLNEWVMVRHSIAHGSMSLPEVAVLRQAGSRSKSRRYKVTHADATACMRFFTNLAVTTTDAASDRFAYPKGLYPKLYRPGDPVLDDG